jgi:hypothetical protein
MTSTRNPWPIAVAEPNEGQDARRREGRDGEPGEGWSPMRARKVENDNG